MKNFTDANNYQIWDDGQMAPPVNSRSRFTATRTSEPHDGWEMQEITPDGKCIDRGWVNGLHAATEQEAIDILLSE